jgi:hypothetical protein
VITVGRVLLGCLDNRLLARLDWTTFSASNLLNSKPCSWCGDDVDPADGFRAYEPAGGRRASLSAGSSTSSPWAIQGSRWGPAGVTSRPKRGLRAARIASHSSPKGTSYWCAIAPGTVSPTASAA